MIAEAAPQTLSRLLALYPVSSLKEKWPKYKKKDEIINWAPQNVGLKEIKDFLDEYLSCCKQHVYAYSHQSDVGNLPRFRMPGSEKVLEIEDGKARRLLYVAEVEYHVVFTEPLMEDTITFLWPIRLDFAPNQLVVRFVTLEKDLRTYFGNKASATVGRSVTESMVLSHLGEALANLQPLDINKGIKHLWDGDRIEGLRARYKKARSTSTEAMDAGSGIKQTYPDLYKILIKAPLFDCVFGVPKQEESSISGFSCNPTGGYLSFPTYSEKKGDTDKLVSEIFRHN